MGKTDQKEEVGKFSDAWDRFERAVDVVAKSPPQHRTKGEKSPKKKQKKKPAQVHD
jgi:hypothetical protein